MKQALLINIGELSCAEMGLGRKVYQKLLDIEEDKIPITVLGVGCEVDGIFEHDYHDIQFKDGTEVDALSGYHLQLIP